MESATNELLQLNNGGVLVWFHELLWAKCPAEVQQAESQNRDSSSIVEKVKNNSRQSAVELPPHLADLPRTPHTVIFNYSHAQGWFFDPNSLQHQRQHNKHHCAPRMKRKRKMHLTAAHIVEEFLTPLEFRPTSSAVVQRSKSANSRSRHEGDDDDRGDDERANNARRRSQLGAAIPGHHIVAQLVTRQSDYTEADAKPKVRYLNQSLLEQLLYKDTIAEGSVLQRFVPPQGPASSDPNLNPNAALLVQWQPNYCYVERFVNLYSLNDHTKTTFERGATLDSTLYSESVSVKDGASVLLQARRCCNAMAEHVRQVVGLHMRTMTVVLKITPENHLILMWVQQAVVMEQGRIHASLLTGATLRSSEHSRDERHKGGVEGVVDATRGAAAAASLQLQQQPNASRQKARLYQAMMQQRLIPTDEQREQAALERQSYHDRRNNKKPSGGALTVASSAHTGAPSYSTKRILLPEQQADAKFDGLAPRSWSRSRDAFRFSGIVKSRPSSAAAKQSTVIVGNNTASEGTEKVFQRPNSAATLQRVASTTSTAASPLMTDTNPATRQGSSIQRVVSLVRAHMASGSLSRTMTPTFDRELDAVDDVKSSPPAAAMAHSASVDSNPSSGAADVARDVVSALSWSSPTRVDLSLLPRAACDGSSFVGWNQERFPRELLAHHAGRLGLREKYLASMRQASTTQHNHRHLGRSVK